MPVQCAVEIVAMRTRLVSTTRQDSAPVMSPIKRPAPYRYYHAIEDCTRSLRAGVRVDTSQRFLSAT